MKLEDKTMKALATAMNFRQMRQEIISSNIANADTPGYKAKELSFEDALARALDVDGTNSLRTQNERHFDVGGGGFNNLQPHIYEQASDIVSEDGNTVDRDKEMAEMVDNRIQYDAAVQLMNKKLALMKYILGSEGR